MICTFCLFLSLWFKVLEEMSAGFIVLVMEIGHINF